MSKKKIFSKMSLDLYNEEKQIEAKVKKDKRIVTLVAVEIEPYEKLTEEQIITRLQSLGKLNHLRIFFEDQE